MKTNSNNNNNSKSNKTKSIIALTSLIIVLSIVNITLLTGTIFGININTTTNASALSYSTSEDISFTFAPTLSIGLSTNNLTIDNLVPGTTSDSNVVSVTVSSNTPYGYVLSAGVGSNDTTSPYYNTSSLTHENSTISNVFSSVDTNASLDSLTTDNTWGYSTSTNGGTSWSTYSGLSHTATKPLLDISDPATPSTIDFKIAARSATTQASGTYNNVITFYAVGKPETHYLYEEVAKMSKGTQTAEELQTAITKDNSGVYEYNSAVFGESSDASNANKIYYYRGILDNVTTQYGSDGDGEAYPNYIILSSAGEKSTTDTCWRIVRTTGSGGVKMIYNGFWTGITCANAEDLAQYSTFRFNGYRDQFLGDTYKQAVRIGYTYDKTYATPKTLERPLSELFGTNASDNNTTSSDIKNSVDLFYSQNNLSSYNKILEASAGYCGDRTMYSTSYVLQPESISITQYTSGMTTQYYTGAYVRNQTTYQLPSLTCAKHNDGITLVDRSKVDLYSVKGSPDGNGRLSYPIALLTADEVSFAGYGSYYASSGSAYHQNSFIRSGSAFWLLSPFGRTHTSNAYISIVDKYNGLHVGTADQYYGIRPVISLRPGTEYTSGSGTATDPWIVPAP